MMNIIAKAKKEKNKSIKMTLQEFIYIYRFDIFAVTIMVSFIILFIEGLFRPGQIVFSDIDFPFNSSTYMDEVFGIWNVKWNTTSMLNIPRLIVLLPSFLISTLANNNGDLFLKVFLLQNLVISGLSFYLFCKRLLSIYIVPNFNLSRIFIIIFGSLYYALNPWVVFRIQHIYLLVGYSFFPIILLLFFKVFDHKFLQVSIKDYSPFDPKLHKSVIRDIILLAMVITVASAAIHYFFYSAFLLAPMLMLLILKYSIQYRKQDKHKIKLMWINLLKKIVLLGVVFAGFSFYWLFIYIGGIIFDVQASQNNINVVDTYVAFSRYSSLTEVLYLTSYWWPMIDMRELPFSFYLGGGFILVFSILGLTVNAIRHHLVLFMGLLSGFLIVFSVGVHYPISAGVFLIFTELPLIGTIFRDPNKLVALLALFIGVFFVFGLIFLLKQVEQLGKTRNYMITLIISVASLSLLNYLLPMKTLYFDHFYAPIEEPKEYLELRDFYNDGKNHYGIYLPLSDEMIQPFSRVSTPYWNVNQFSNSNVTKATGDVHVYNSPIPTLFQFEGNDPTIHYYLNYLQFLLDQGRTNQFGKSLEVFGSNQFIYHDEYLQQYYRQDFNLDAIKMDESLVPVFNNDIFTVFDQGILLQERDQAKSLIRQMILTPYGFDRAEVFKKMGIYQPLKAPIVYLNQKTSQAKTVNDIQLGLSGIASFVEAKNEKDLIMSNLPESYFLYPFDWTNRGNVFLGWSKTFLSSVDWKWFVESQDIIDRSFEFDRGKGVAVTFASKKLDVQPYLRNTIKGNLIMDFDTMLRTENVFIADNPDMLEINLNPYSEIKEFQTIRGELIKGESKDIWQVAKSGVLDATGSTPYFFELLISGRDIDKIHLKVRFYDKNSEEIGVSYIVSSDEKSNFDTIKFIGEVVSPSETEYMRIDLLSFLNPQYKSYWWLHDINIYELSQYASDNLIQGEYNAQSNGVYDIYVRSFNSGKGGLIEVSVGDDQFAFETFDEGRDSFEWNYIGSKELKKGIYPVSLNGKDGFNGVNAIVIIPKNEYQQAKEKIASELNNAGIIMSFEPVTDLYYFGNIQSKRIYPTLSMGKGVAFQNGKITGKFDVMIPDVYTFYPNVQYVYDNKGYAYLRVYKDEELIHEVLLDNRTRISDKEKIVESNTRSETYQYSFLDMETPFNFEDKQGYPILLDVGNYRFEVELVSETDSMSKIEDIKPFDGSVINYFPESVDPNNIVSCIPITQDMMRDRILDDTLILNFDPTCSMDWYSYATNLIDVKSNQEILVEFEARSEFLKNRHAKVIFLDENNYFLKDVFINEVEEQYKISWNLYEQLVKVPEGAEKMLIQFLGNGDRIEFSSLEIRKFGVYNYNEFILLDHVFVENSTAQRLLNQNIVSSDSVVERRQSQFGLQYTLNNNSMVPKILNTFISPNNNWVINNSRSDVVLNGVTQGFVIRDESEIRIDLFLMKGYIAGLVLLVLTILTTGFWLIKNR